MIPKIEPDLSLEKRDEFTCTTVHTCDTISPTEWKAVTVTISAMPINTMRAADSIKMVAMLRSGKYCSFPNVRIIIRRCRKSRVTIIEVMSALRNTEIESCKGKRMARGARLFGNSKSSTDNAILRPKLTLIDTRSALIL